jgi:SAM-dependent methyltransferase
MLEAFKELPWAYKCYVLCYSTASLSAFLLIAAKRRELRILTRDCFAFILTPPKVGIYVLGTLALEEWEPELRFDLITCVHGLHYVGDKLGLIARACRWLTPDGQFIAHLDPHNLRHADGRDAARRGLQLLREHGLDFSPRRGVLRAKGCRDFTLSCHYLGADANAGPNRTGQDAVNSHYEFL